MALGTPKKIRIYPTFHGCKDSQRLFIIYTVLCIFSTKGLRS